MYIFSVMKLALKEHDPAYLMTLYSSLSIEVVPLASTKCQSRRKEPPRAHLSKIDWFANTRKTLPFRRPSSQAQVVCSCDHARTI